MSTQFTVKVSRYLNCESRITTLHISADNIQQALTSADYYCRGAREATPDATFDVADITRHPRGIDCDMGWETGEEFSARIAGNAGK